MNLRTARSRTLLGTLTLHGLLACRDPAGGVTTDTSLRDDAPAPDPGSVMILTLD